VHLAKFFKDGGHVSTNIAKMFPKSYLYEHQDNTSKLYGAYQETLIKLQIPLFNTDSAAVMWIEDQSQGYPKTTVVNMVEGGVHIIDNIKRHSSINLDTHDRYLLTTRYRMNSVRDPATVSA